MVRLLIPLLLSCSAFCSIVNAEDVPARDLLHRCVYTHAMRFPHPASDARTIASASMAACQPELDIMRKSFVGDAGAFEAARQEAFKVAESAAEAMHQSRRKM